MEGISFGLDGDWFLRTNARHGMSPHARALRSYCSLSTLAKKETTLQHARQITPERARSQFGGSFSPASPYGQVNVPVYIPFGANLNPYPGSGFTCVPQQPPVYNNTTHVHVNQITQAQQSSALPKQKAVSTLLGGALKLAVAVLSGGGGLGLGIGS